jgi:hypothetical protein
MSRSKEPKIRERVARDNELSMTPRIEAGDLPACWFSERCSETTSLPVRIGNRPGGLVKATGIAPGTLLLTIASDSGQHHETQEIHIAAYTSDDGTQHRCIQCPACLRLRKRLFFVIPLVTTSKTHQLICRSCFEGRPAFRTGPRRYRSPKWRAARPVAR